jgi:ketosteroid isomerase-like protein
MLAAMNRLALFRHYLDRYAAKDLAAIGTMFDEHVHLRDWNISVHGPAAALAETQRNFESARSIVIEVLHVHESDSAVAGELRVVVDGSTVLHVTDVVVFTPAGKIAAIRAYLGRAD